MPLSADMPAPVRTQTRRAEWSQLRAVESVGSAIALSGLYSLPTRRLMKNREFLIRIGVDKDVIGTTVNMKKQWLKGEAVFDRQSTAPWWDAWVRVVAVRMGNLEPVLSSRD